MENNLVKKYRFQRIEEVQPIITRMIMRMDIFDQKMIYHSIKSFLVYAGFSQFVADSMMVEKMIDDTVDFLVEKGWFYQNGFYYIKNRDLKMSNFKHRKKLQTFLTNDNILPLILANLKEQGIPFIDDSFLKSVLQSYYNSEYCKIYQADLFSENITEKWNYFLQMSILCGFLSTNKINVDGKKRFIMIREEDISFILEFYSQQVLEVVQDLLSRMMPVQLRFEKKEKNNFEEV